MDKQILNSLNKGEHIVEMQEYILHNQTVYEVTIHTCQSKNIFNNIFNKSNIKTFKFPFYFKSKEIAEDFLKYWDEIWLYDLTYWKKQKNNNCYGLYVKDDDSNTYYMVDSYKYENSKHFDDKCQLERNGIWGGIVNTDGHFFTVERNNINFKKIFELENIAQKVDKNPYVFKMIK